MCVPEMGSCRCRFSPTFDDRHLRDALPEQTPRRSEVHQPSHLNGGDERCRSRPHCVRPLQSRQDQKRDTRRMLPDVCKHLASDVEQICAKILFRGKGLLHRRPSNT